MQVQALHFVRDILQTVLRAVLVTFISAPIAALAVAGITEAVAAIVTHHFPGSSDTHILAIVLALVFGYAVALTYAVVECVRGAIYVGERLERDILGSRPRQ